MMHATGTQHTFVDRRRAKYQDIDTVFAYSLLVRSLSFCLVIIHQLLLLRLIVPQRYPCPCLTHIKIHVFCPLFSGNSSIYGHHLRCLTVQGLPDGTLVKYQRTQKRSHNSSFQLLPVLNSICQPLGSFKTTAPKGRSSLPFLPKPRGEISSKCSRSPCNPSSTIPSN